MDNGYQLMCFIRESARGARNVLSPSAFSARLRGMCNLNVISFHGVKSRPKSLDNHLHAFKPQQCLSHLLIFSVYSSLYSGPNNFCHLLLTLTPFKTCMTFICLWNIKEDNLKNVSAVFVHIMKVNRTQIFQTTIRIQW